MNDALDLPTSVAANAALVPAGYAEKAMASLMQMHAELMEEKERRVDLFRTLMQKEQALSDLKMYVKLLEQKVAAAEAPKAAAPVTEAPRTERRAPSRPARRARDPSPSRRGSRAASARCLRRPRARRPLPRRSGGGPRAAAAPPAAPSSRLQNLPPLPKRAEGWKAW